MTKSQDKELRALKERIDILERVVLKLSSLTGNSNHAQKEGLPVGGMRNESR